MAQPLTITSLREQLNRIERRINSITALSWRRDLKPHEWDRLNDLTMEYNRLDREVRALEREEGA